jgi:hypothetical protein
MQEKEKVHMVAVDNQFTAFSYDQSRSFVLPRFVEWIPSILVPHGESPDGVAG